MTKPIPKSLTIWFFIHFVMDMLFGIPLILIPRQLLTLLGWTVIDPFTTRLVGAALIGIGLVSLVEIRKGIESYHSLLKLKVMWSLAAIVGIFISMLEGAPAIGWLLLGIFVVFSLVWMYYLKKFHKS